MPDQHHFRRAVLLGLCLAIPTQCWPAGIEPGGEETTVKVAAVSFVPEKFDLHGNAARLEKAFRAARLRGAELAVAPEGALDGYVVNEIIAGKTDPQRMYQVAISIEHPIIARFRQLAAELQMCLVFGFAERIDTDVYNCAVFIDHHGKICGKYHKMQFAEGYDPDWWFNRLGRSSRAFDTPLGRCGILICNDRWNPALARIPALDGAQLLLIPAFGSRSKTQDEAVLNRSRENQIPVVEANVGVTLIADGNRITALDRQEEGISFGEITIKPSTLVNPAKRDETETTFLQWRKQEMKRRLQRTIKKNQKPGDPRL